MNNKTSLFRIFILFAAVCCVNISIAAEDDKKYLLTEKNWNKLSEINKLLDSDQADIAINRLKALSTETQDIVYDSAVVQQTLGYAYLSIDDYPNAIISFQQALNFNALPPNVIHDLEFNLAQLLIYSKNYEQGLNYFHRWFDAEPNPGIEAYILAGTAYYESKQYKNTIPYVEKVIQLKGSFDETWHQILLSCYLQTRQYEQAASLLERMLKIQPENRSYWQQLLATWQQTNNDQKILATMELMHAKGLYEAEEIKQLINMYLYMDLPYKAADLLTIQLTSGNLAKDKTNLELLGHSWLQAQEREKAATTLLEASKFSNKGDLHFQIGQIYFELEDYAKASEQLKIALSKGQLEQKEFSQLLLGISQFHQRNYDQSQDALQLALQNRSTNAQANWWLQRIDDLNSEKEQQLEIN